MLIDVHCHANLYLNLEQIIKEAKAVGVKKIIAVAMSAKSQDRVIEIAEKFEPIYPALGIHPEEVKMNPQIEEQLEEICIKIEKNNLKLCAIGEIGLDHHFVKNAELYPLQKKIFDRMLELAQKLCLPVNIHTKGAEEIIFNSLPSYNLPNINIHWYSGPETFLKRGIDRGYFFSITPALKYSTAVKKTVLSVDIDHLLLESDGPVRYTGTIGTPAMIRELLPVIGELKQITNQELEEKLYLNTKTIFPKLFC